MFTGFCCSFLARYRSWLSWAVVSRLAVRRLAAQHRCRSRRRSAGAVRATPLDRELQLCLQRVPFGVLDRVDARPVSSRASGEFDHAAASTEEDSEQRDHRDRDDQSADRQSRRAFGRPSVESGDDHDRDGRRRQQYRSSAGIGGEGTARERPDTDRAADSPHPRIQPEQLPHNRPSVSDSGRRGSA